VIRDEMEQTRANLAEKLGALENQVRETVSGATDAVNSTVEGVKDVVSTVSETVETVTETFNVSRQVEQPPWLSVGAAVATGFVVAQVIGRVGGHHHHAAAPAHHAAPAAPPPQPAPELRPQPLAGQQRQPERREEEHSSGLMHSIESLMPDLKGVMNTMVSSLGGLAVGSLMGVIREMASGSLPKEWQGEVTKLVDQVTSQLGGKVLDPARSGHLLHALGLDGRGSDSNGGDQGGRQREGQQRQEGAPYDSARQQQQGVGHTTATRR